MADKKIEIGIRGKMELDEQSLRDMQQKLNRMVQMSRQAEQAQQYGGKFGGIASSVFGQYNKETVNNMRQQHNQEMRQLQERDSKIKQLTKDMERQKELSTKTTDQYAKRAEAMDKILKSEKELQTIQTQGMAQRLNAARQISPGLGGFEGVEGGGGGPAGGVWAPGGMAGRYRGFRGMGLGRGPSRFLTRFGGPLAAAGGAAAGALPAAHSIWEELAMKQGNIALAEGKVMGRTGQMAGELQNPNKIMEAAAFRQERMKSLGIVGEEIQSQRGRDVLGGITGPGMLSRVAGGAAGGAAVGAGFFGVGAIPGAIAGGIGGLLSPLATNKRTRGALLGTEEYHKQITGEALMRQSKIEQAQKLANVPKQLAWQAMQQRMPDIMRAESAFGDIGAGAPGTMLRGITGAGMTGRTGMGIGQQMMKVGGITPGAGDVGDIQQAFQLQQGGLTNAGRLTGAVRGLARGFGEQATDESMKKLFAEAVKMGVDDSSMVEELRQFTDASVNLALERGIRVEEAGELISRGSAGAMSAPNLKSAITAAKMRDRESGFGSGEDFAYKMGFVGTKRGQELMGQMSFPNQLAFAGLREGDITADNSLVSEMMRELDLDITDPKDLEKFKKIHAEVNLAPKLKTAAQRKAFSDLQQKAKGKTTEEFQAMTRPGGAAEGEMAAVMRGQLIQKGDVFGALGFREKEAYARSIGPEAVGRRGAAGVDLGAGVSGRGAQTLGFRREEGLAGAEQRQYEALQGMEDGVRYVDMFVDNMSKIGPISADLLKVVEEMKDAAGKSTTSIATFAKALDVAMSDKLSPEEKAKQLGEIAEQMEDLKGGQPQSLPQTGKYR